MNELKEQKIQVLEINVEELKQNLEEIGASKVYDDMEIITTLNPASKVSINRVSYKLGKIDFNIDTFPMIPSFLEINFESLEEEYSIEELLKRLGLVGHSIVVMGKENLHRFYGIDYFDAYKIDGLQENRLESPKGPSK